MWNLFCIIFIHWNHYCRQKMCMKHPGNHVHWCFSIVYRPIILWRQGSSISVIFMTSLWTIRDAGGLLVPEGIIRLVLTNSPHLYAYETSWKSHTFVLVNCALTDCCLMSREKYFSYVHDEFMSNSPCWWTISSQGYHPPSSQYFGTDMIY